METELKGLFAAVYTPFDKEKRLNLDVLEKQARKLVADGIIGVFICGTTGEGLHLTKEERKLVAEKWAEVGSGFGLKVIVHVGHTSQKDAIDLAKHASGLNVFGVASIVPGFHKADKPKSAVETLKPIADACPNKHFFYYHIPMLTGIPLEAYPILEYGLKKIPNMKGVKFTDTNLLDFVKCLSLKKDGLVSFWGVDAVLLSALALGCRSAIGSTYNYAGPLHQIIWNSFERGDLVEAAKYTQKAVRLVGLLKRFGLIGAGKAIMNMVGIDVGPPRPPNFPLDENERNEVYNELEKLGLVELLGLLKPGGLEK